MLSEYSPSDIAWIGALQVFLLYLGGALSGPLSDRYGVKVSDSRLGNNLFKMLIDLVH